MEAVRLGLQRGVTRVIREYASDRVGVHPTATAWDGFVDRRVLLCSRDACVGVTWVFPTDGFYGTGVIYYR